MADTPRHTLTAFDDEITSLRGLLAEMGSRGEAATADAMTALARHDTEAAAKVVDADHHIDALEKQVETMVVRTIALRAPVADDLREVVAALRMSAVFERVGDYAKNIAKRVARIGSSEFLEDDNDLLKMGQIATEMVRGAVEAHARRDVDLARSVCRRDSELDQLYKNVFVDLVAELAKQPDRAEDVANLLFISKNLERIGDHATNAAEMVYFVMTGQPLPEGERR